MKFDATHLIQPDQSPVLAHPAAWGAPDWPHASRTWTAPLTGVLRFSIDGTRTISLDGSFVDSITLGPGLAEVDIVFDSPVPGHHQQATLGFRLSYLGNGWQVKFGQQWKKWLKTRYDSHSGMVDDWIGKPTPEAYETTFPFGQDGLRIALPGQIWPSGLDIYAGVFVGPDQRPFAVVMPKASRSPSDRNLSAGLPLDGLDTVELGGDLDINDWTCTPALLYLPLDAPAPAPAWDALVYWSPLEAGKPGHRDRLRTNDLLETAWNEAVLTLLHAQRSSHGAQPWLPLPVLSRVKADNGAAPILKFGIAPSAPGPAPLVHAYLCAPQRTTYEATFDWQAGAILDKQFAQPAPLAGTALTFALTLTQAPAPWSSDAATVPALLGAATAPVNDPTLLADWHFSVDSVTKGPSGSPWITLGSLEFALPEPGLVNPQENSSLDCGLRGAWTETQRDLFPEVSLSFACRVRVSAATDPGLRKVSAEFDVANAAEEALHNDSEPLRHALDADSGRPCQLTIRHTSAPGRNAVVAMEVRSLVRAPLGGDALYFQARPFVFARVHPVEIDDQAGELIAVWRSDDADGAQWRMPDTTLAFDLPPQAVGEEMERGNRFWPSGAPYIEPGSALRYRFAPPTTVTVQPSVLARRYNKNPSNLAEALRGAKVQSFTTEIAYPVQVRFAVSDRDEPDVRIAETAAFLGHPAPTLPLPPAAPPSGRPVTPAVTARIADDARRWAATVLSGELAPWTAAPDGAAVGPHWASFLAGYGALRSAHNANQANFAARLAQFHLYDPWSKDGGLHLREGLTFRIRGTREHAPPMLNPLPRRRPVTLPGGGLGTEDAPVDLLPAQKQSLLPFLKGDDWVRDDDDSSGALRAGVLHTIEFASELLSILRTPDSTNGSIDTLAFTALGASGRFSAAFDEGRASFIVETQHGQLSRLIKVRIGRIALLWNRAKHVTVYERTTVPSKQFESEQPTLQAQDTRGWPILRKTEEYVEPVDLVREFAGEAQKENNATGFVEAGEFISRRIYVNSAWGRDLVHGYELPLWNRAYTSGFYPKPQLALRMHAGGGNRSRSWLDEPEHLYFYSNTEEGTGDNPDRWDPKPGVDCPAGVVRLPVLCGAGLKSADYLDMPAVPAPRLAGARRPRFDLAVSCDGKVNLQHGRGDTEMLVTLGVVAMARTDETGAPAFDEPSATGKLIRAVGAASGLAADYAAVEQRVRSLLDRLPRQMLESGLDCDALVARLKRDIDALFDGLAGDLNKLGTPPAGAEPAVIAKEWATAVCGDVGATLGQWEYGTVNTIKQVFELALKDVKALQEAALQVADQAAAAQVRDVARGRLRSLVQQTQAGIAAAHGLLDGQFTRLVHGARADVTAALDALELAIKALPAAPGSAAYAEFSARLAALRALMEKARQVPALGPVASKAIAVLDHAREVAAEPAAQVQGLATTLLALLRTTPQPGSLRATLDRAWDMADNVSASVHTAITRVGAQAGNWAAAADTLLQDLEAATEPQQLRTVLQAWVRAIEARLGSAADALLTQVKADIDTVRGHIDREAAALTGDLAALAGGVAGLAQAAQAAAGTWLAQARSDAHALVDVLDCGALGTMHAQLDAMLGTVEAKLRDQVTGALGALTDEATRQRLDQLKGLASTVGKGIKLGKALGDLPALPTLRFNAERAEYVFDDIRKQIDTSPFAARLREIDSGLKELGLAVPTRQLLDQIVPDAWRDLDFNRIFKNLGGLDFQDYFKRFRLPQLSGDKLKITHGLDKATRSAWVKTTVNADFPEEHALFEFSGMAVRVARMQLRANSDVRLSADGQSRAVTDGRFSGDWALEFGGARMATFQDVTVSFDGHGFDFNVSPDKVLLHPSLKFIQEYARQFSDKLPPAVQLEKDERGVPVGARASFSTLIDKLPPIPPVTIGPILIASGLGLRMSKAGVFEISAHVALGSRSAPIFVQVSYLGGGFWLEARCTARGGQIVPQASLGLALGSMRAFSLAGVARGSYSVLLFANAEIDGGGGSLHAGLSIAGSARILGIANAALDLLLEVEHRSGGGTTAHGWLHVEIEICWCYTLRVSTAAEHKL